MMTHRIPKSPLKMKLKLLVALTGVLGFGTAQAQSDSPSARIDQFIEAGYKTHSVKPNEPISDELFCRRVYLDIVGRIPSRDEAKEFTMDTAANKRSKLIDKLIDSEGFSSSFFNFWADILRIQSNIDNQEGAGAAYSQWVKDAVRTNMPYDKFVAELVGAKGKIWENGAVGYYLRDTGMPLDNMSNTAQIFLGTRVVCAQCHNHPFDKWKQRDYYEMAAFTYGVQTELDMKSIVPDLDKKLASAGKKIERKGNGRKDETVRQYEGIIRDILQPLTYGVAENPHNLKLPADYKGGQEGYIGQPGEEIVKAKTLFGGDRIDKPGEAVPVSDSTRAGLINWMCDKENPRFTQVIVNRLWKRTFGVGLVEPVDDFKDDTVASNPALMRFLTETMAREKYNQRAFLKHLYKTKTYQRAATTTEISLDNPYYFPGPALRRMTAEQLWDSVVTLMIPNPDYRKRPQSFNDRLAAMKEAADDLEKKFIKAPNGTEALIAMAAASIDARAKFDGPIAAKRKEVEDAVKAKDDKKAAALRAEMNKLTADRDKAMYAAQGAAEEKAEMDAEKSTFFKPRPQDDKMAGGMMNSNMDSKGAPVDPKASNISAAEWDGYPEDFYRASELASPAPANHFLRTFGQSDRNVIENAWIDASVTQALSLMNSDLYEKLTSDKSQLSKALSNAITPSERATLLWTTCMGRKPTEKEQAIVAEFYKKLPAGRQGDGWKELFWSVLNGREFMFIQ